MVSSMTAAAPFLEMIVDELEGESMDRAVSETLLTILEEASDEFDARITAIRPTRHCCVKICHPTQAKTLFKAALLA